MSTSSSNISTDYKVALGLPAERETGTPIFTIKELQAAIGREMQGDWFKIDPEANDTFCQSTFLNAVYSEEQMQSGYEADLVEGFYLVSLIDALKTRVYRDNPGYYALNYGSNKLRFIEQVTLRSVLRLSCVVQSVTPKKEGYLVEIECCLNIKGVERPAVVYSSIYYLLPLHNDGSGSV